MGRGRKGTLPLLLFFLSAGISFPGRWAYILRIQEIPNHRIIWEKIVKRDDRFTLVHRNSIYRVWVEERFQVSEDGALLLTAVRTESPAVWEYYGIETSAATWFPLSRTFPSLQVAVTPNGEFFWEWEGQRLDLSRSLGRETSVEIRPIPAPFPAAEEDL